ncbi:MAG: DUF3326 domain-containing protein [Candidatus Sericytochromatia bacterium]
MKILFPTRSWSFYGSFSDTNPFNTVLESICDNVITHPNAVNAASLYSATQKTLYVEGLALDKFLEGKINLKKSHNKIGIIIDKKAKPKEIHIINAINSCSAVFGAEILAYTFTEEEIGARITKEDNGLFGGIIKDKNTIYKSCEKLINQGVTAIAIFAVLENPFEEQADIYLTGVGVDPIGRIEAMISHLIVEKTNLPAAHAPVFLEDYERTIVDPRVSAEEIGYTYIPCVIRGLQFAPSFVDNNYISHNTISINDISAVVCPLSVMNGDWVKSCLNKNIPIMNKRKYNCFR